MGGGGGGALSEETEMQSHGGILAEPCMEIPAWISLAVEAYFQQSAGQWQKRGVEKPQGYHLGDNLVVLSQMSPAVAARIDPLAAEVDLENLALQDTATVEGMPQHERKRISTIGGRGCRVRDHGCHGRASLTIA